MDSDEELLCPWCQTLIRWDPEIGPEEECPHCFNELGAYRSVNLTVGKPGLGRAANDEDDVYDPDDEPIDLEDLADFRDGYDDRVQQLTDSQDEAPECPACREFMLHAGRRTVKADEFAPAVPELLGKPLLSAPFVCEFYVCPHCFRTDTVLSGESRLAMVRLLRGDV